MATVRGKLAAPRQGRWHRPPVLSLAGFVAGLVVLGPGGAAGADEVAAPLRVVPASVEVGPLPVGAVEHLEFVISNESDREVALVYIHGECDCSLAVPASGVVPARGRFLLAADLLLDGARPGRLEERITILTDHPELPALGIPVTATVVAAGEGESDRGRGSTDRAALPPPAAGDGGGR